MTLNNNLEHLITPYLNEILNNFISNLESSLELKGNFTKEEKNEFIIMLAEIMETVVGYEDLVSPTIKDKIINIKHLLLKTNTVHNSKEHLFNTQPLLDTQEN